MVTLSFMGKPGVPHSYKVSQTRIFPSNEPAYNDLPPAGSPTYDAGAEIIINWEGIADIGHLVMLASAYRLRAPRAPLHLKMSYMPFARMDRPMGNELFTLQALAKVLNDFQFDTVQTLDAHSNVTSSLIHRCVDVTPLEAITNAMCMFANNSSDMVFTMLPDEGAAKRYRATIMRAMEWANGHVQGELRATILEGRKHRNPITGALESFSLAAGAKDLLTAIEKGISPSVLIVDDICSYGGTFVKAAQAVRSMGVSRVGLYVTHLEGVGINATLLSDNGVDVIYTTDSLSNLPRPLASEDLVKKDRVNLVCPAWPDHMTF